MFDYLYSIILGVVQGIAEFLPISSSAHLIVVSSFLTGEHLSLTLNVALHLGTLISVLVYFFKDFYSIGMGCLKKDPLQLKMLLILVVGSIPAGIIGVIWEDDIEELFHNPLSVTVPLVIVGILMYVIDKKRKQNLSLHDMSVWQGFLIGCSQAIALIPGVSRSGITISQARFLGFDKISSARFSFLLGTPAMIGACILKSKDILAHISDPIFYVGVITSMLAGFLAIGFLLRFIAKYSFLSFMWYRIILAGVILVVYFF